MELFNSRNYKPGSANFETYFLDFSQDIVQVKPTKKLFFFYGIFAVIGLSVMLLPLFIKMEPRETIWITLIFGFIFLAIGAGGIIGAKRRCYPLIDFHEKMFYPLGRNKETLPDAIPKIPLNEVEGIGITSKMVSGEKNHYRCYTLSLKCTKNREFLLLNHGAAKAFSRDAGKLSKRMDLLIQGEDAEARRRADNTKAAPFLMIFSLIWMGFSGYMLWQIWKVQELFPKIFIGVFILVGLIMFLYSLILLLLRKKKKENKEPEQTDETKAEN
ncbi:MAG: hypothetical protein IJW23_03250 [Lentisphaeria bacterium]|nr:hypothetical protein [Lentisphaeria bacterium]